MFTKGEWRVMGKGTELPEGQNIIQSELGKGETGIMNVRTICKVFNYCDLPEAEANANLIASAPLGHRLAEFVARLSATWMDDGLLEIGEGDYIHIKKLALELLAKVEGK